MIFVWGLIKFGIFERREEVNILVWMIFDFIKGFTSPLLGDNVCAFDDFGYFIDRKGFTFWLFICWFNWFDSVVTDSKDRLMTLKFRT